MFSTGVLRGHEGSPLVIGDTMYLHTPFPNNVFAIDLGTQKIKWKYAPKQDPAVIPQMCCDTVNRGLAYADGKVFLQQADSTLVALDAKTRQGGLVASRTAIRRSARSTPMLRTSSRTRSSPASAAASGVCAATSPRTTSRPASMVWRGYSTGPDSEMMIDPNTTTTWTDGKVAAGRRRLQPEDLEGRSVEDRRRHDLGLVQL